MKRYLLLIAGICSVVVSFAQSTIRISSGTTVVGSGNVQIGATTATFVNDGSYSDAAGTFNALAGITFSGSGSTSLYNMNLNNTGTNTFGAQVSVYNTATITTGTTVAAGGNLWIRSDANTTSNLVNNGLLTGAVAGLVARAASATLACPSTTTDLSLNVSGSSMVYQWQSSADSSAWADISSATSATFTATPGVTKYYRCNLSTSNTAFTQSTPGVKITVTGALPVVAAIGGTLTVVIGGTTSLTDATASGVWSSTNAAAGTVNTSGVVSGIGAGTTTISYAVTNGCGTTAATVVATVNSVLSATQSQANITCFGSNNGTATVVASGGTPGYTYSWAPSGGTGATATGLSMGSYTCTITDAASASITKTFNITEPSILTSSVSSVTNVSCNGLSNGAGTISASGGTPSYSYSWAPSGGTAATATGLAAGTYTVTITDANSCTKTQTATISQPSVITSSVSATTNVSCNGLSNGAATISAGGGTPSYSYSWAPSGGTAATATGLAAGTYTVTITDANSCTKTQTVTITQPSAVTITTTSNSGPVCVGSTLNFTGAATGGTGTISYSWSGPSSFSSTDQNPSITSVTSAANGIYTLTVTDANSCTAAGTHTTSPTINARPVISSIGNNAPICSTFNLDLTSSVSSGQAPYSYSWSGPNTFSSTVQNPVISAATTSATGTYTLAVTDNNGCTNAGASTTAATVNPRPVVASIDNNGPICAGVSLDITSTVTGGTGTLAYSWAGPVAYTSTSANPSIAAAGTNRSGTYTLTITDGVGCHAIGTNTTAATVNPRATLSAIGNSGPVCASSTLNLTSTATGGTAPLSYTWSGSNTFSSTASNPSITGATTAATGVYTLIVSDVNGCIPTGTNTTSATVNPRPVISAIGNNGPICSGVTLNLTSTASGGTGTLGYSWSGPNTFTSTASNPSITAATTAATGTYTLTVTDVNSCGATGTNTTAATVNPRATLSAIGNSGPVCASSTLNLTSTATGGTAPLSYTWSGPNTFSSTLSNPSITGATTAATGVYTLVVTDVNGCMPTGTNTTSATVNPQPSISSIGNNGPICSGFTLNLNSTAGGGTGTLVYAWSGPNTFTSSSASPSITGAATAATGTYTLVVTDANSCAATGTNTTAAIVNPIPALSAISNDGPVCAGNTLDLTATASGGTAPLAYSWSGPNSFTATDANTSITGATTAATGTYTLTVTDVNGCQPTDANTTAATVDPLPATITGGGNVCAGLTITLNDATGTGTWSSSDATTASVNSTSGVVTGNTTGVATISYILSTGCYMTTAVSVNPFPAAITGPTSICAGNNITMSDAMSGGSWSSSNTSVVTIGATSGIVTAAAAGTANISYTSDRGCTVVTAVPVNNLVSAISGNTGTCTGLTYTLTDGTTGGSWSSSNSSVASIGSSTGIVSGVSGGAATITYATAGCYRTQPATISTAPPDLTGTTEVCIGHTVTMSDGIGGGAWGSSNTFIAGVVSGVVTGVSAGTVNITYQLSSTCKTISVITVDPTPVLTGNTIVCLNTTNSFSTSIPGGTWTSGSTSTATVDASGNVTGVAVGTTMITYTPATGCYKTVIVTVTPLPATITGAGSICAGTATTYVDGTTGGLSWISSNTSVATIGITSGVLTAVATGTATITYSLTTACITTSVVTVNAQPDVITGTPVTCVGNTTTLASGTSGGTWASSLPVYATVDASGIVSGLAMGTTYVTYTVSSLGSGCMRTQMVTINPLPAAITGPMTVCTGSSATLANTATGGTWSSSNTAVASIGSSTGIVTGAAAGTAMITYTLTTGCIRTAVVTVNTIASITGATSFCVGQAATLSNATGGGTWSSTATGVATINPPSGLLTAVAPGTAAITYMVSAGCVTSTVVTVNTTPATITGTMNVNIAATTTLSDAVSGGVWSSSNASLGTVDASSGVVTGIASGTVVIYYTIGSCSKSASVTVNTTLSPITGPSTICVGSSVVLTCPIGLSWSSSDPSVATIGATSGSMTGISVGTTVITYTAYSGSYVTKVISVNAFPAAISGPSTACPGLSIPYTDAATGGTWASSYTISATIDSNSGILTTAFNGVTNLSYTLLGCTVSKTITVNPIPAVITSATNILCVASSVALSDVTGGCTWSSATPAIATIGSAGLVSGVSAGTAVISFAYTTTGCARTTVVTVNTMTMNTGSATACTGATDALSNATSGGTWVSAAAGIATVNSAGIVTGVTTGNAPIIYTLSPGCKDTTVVSVLASPAAITGTLSVCAGQVVTLGDVTASGTWSSGTTGLATVVAGTGVVTGVSAGTAVISYTAPNTCVKTANVLVKALPAVITGNAAPCKGVSTNYSDASTPGLSWASSNTATGTIGASTGTFMPLAAGTTNITYTGSNSCYATKTVTVNTAGTVTGPATVSKAASLITPASYTDAVTGGSWTVSNTARATIDPSAGTLVGVSAGTVTVSYSADGCFATLPITITTPRSGSNTTGPGNETVNTIELYPNPTTGTFTVNTSEAGIFSIYTLEGKEVSRTAVTEGANALDMPKALASGIYMCRFTGADGTSAVVRLVYQH